MYDQSKDGGNFIDVEDDDDKRRNQIYARHNRYEIFSHLRNAMHAAEYHDGSQHDEHGGGDERLDIKCVLNRKDDGIRLN